MVTHSKKAHEWYLESTFKQQTLCGQTQEASFILICCLPKVRQTKILSFYGLKFKTKSISYFNHILNYRNTGQHPCYIRACQYFHYQFPFSGLITKACTPGRLLAYKISAWNRTCFTKFGIKFSTVNTKR